MKIAVILHRLLPVIALSMTALAAPNTPKTPVANQTDRTLSILDATTDKQIAAVPIYGNSEIVKS